MKSALLHSLAKYKIKEKSFQNLVENFNFHRFDALRHAEKKVDPRKGIYKEKGARVVTLLFAASKGDLAAIRRIFLQGQDMNQSDYDGRTVSAKSVAACLLNNALLSPYLGLACLCCRGSF